ncbi:YsnF/AvaK domain-containing protein [Parvularcula dongshanensis]|uniref:Uncharacterized protein (TIGR02271 family) n=1 Tax=Parvularcula dongshanensis TaxID=1173995 RepID=A0A840I3A2_9PROT|nr:YsnF/AvaK domain-containing protein [Parvularcula dongshanensis]MBB4658761.1 uncharacterized protein (TIGR02271 family) [Parvularcula dongshanensis]
MNRIVTAVYPNRQQAESAKEALKAAKVDADKIHIIDRASELEGGRYDESSKRYSYLRDSAIPGDELHTYHDALERGETLVQARVDEDDVTEAVRILEGGAALDLDEREKSYTDEHRFGTRNAYRRDYADRAGFFGAGRAAEDDGRTAEDRRDAAPSQLDADDSGHIDLVEERLNIGKRDVDRGAVKVRSYVVEKPFEQDVTLREEEVFLDRHPANRVLSADEANAAFQDRTVEVHARGEEPVIEKEAVVKEEVDVRKAATEKTRHVVDKIRSTEVDVEEGEDFVRKDSDRDDLRADR